MGANKLANKIANIIPSGNAGLTTRINTVIAPARMPNAHLPPFVMAEETGSVAMNIIPKANPPITKCQCQGVAKAGFESEPTRLNKPLNKNIPRKTPATTRHAAMRITRRKAPPSSTSKVEVSPSDHGIVPIKACIQVHCSVTADTPPAAINAR